MADACEESSEDSSDSNSSDNFSIYTETSSSEEDLQNVEELRKCTSSATTHNSRKGKSKSSSKQPTVKRSKRATNSRNDDQMKELTSWIFSTQEANEVECIFAHAFLNHRVLRQQKRGAVSRNICSARNRKQTFNCGLWGLLWTYLTSKEKKKKNLS